MDIVDGSFTLTFRQEIDCSFTIHEFGRGSGVLILLLRAHGRYSQRPYQSYRTFESWHATRDCTGSEEVKTDFILEGSVRKQGDRLRISAQLIDSSSSVYVWSETFERDLSDAFAVQDEISRQS